jgi:uncharacterized membrane protein
MGRICLNWKVLVGLGLVGVGIWAVAPNLFLAALPFLLLAACPLSMLAMMWGMKHVMQSGQNGSQPSQAGLPTCHEPSRGERLGELKARQAAISRETAELERGSQQATAEGESVLRPKEEDSVGRP